MNPATTERLWKKVRITPSCWLWTGATRNGYGRFGFNGNNRLAHRVVYELCVGSIPTGLQLDHVKARGCLHRNCVNPSHLEPVTMLENVKRGGVWEKRRSVSQCKWGHLFNKENTDLIVNPKGYTVRVCKKCRACIARVRYTNKKAVPVEPQEN